MNGADPTARPLRVVLTCDWFVKYAAGLARGLADEGCEVILLTRDHDHEFGDEPGAMRRFVAATLEGRARHLVLGGRVREMDRLREWGRLRRTLARFDPDVVHVQDSITRDPRLALLVGLPWRRYAVTAHDHEPHLGESGLSRPAYLYRWSLMRKASLIFMHAEVLAEEMRKSGHARCPIEVVPHGFATGEEKELPAEPSLLFFGRILPYKGLDVLLDAMPAVWEALPEVKLVIAGEMVEPVEHPVLADPRVTLRAAHIPEADVPGLFADSTCIVMPYRQASQSGVGAEAKRFGRATVASAVGGLPESVGTGTGVLVPPEDPPALAAAIVEVVGTPGLARDLGQEAAATASEEGWRGVAARTVEAYHRHLVRRGA